MVKDSVLGMFWFLASLSVTLACVSADGARDRSRLMKVLPWMHIPAQSQELSRLSALLSLLTKPFFNYWEYCLILAWSYKLGKSSFTFLLQPVSFYGKFLSWQINVFCLFPWKTLCRKYLIVQNWFFCFLLEKACTSLHNTYQVILVSCFPFSLLWESQLWELAITVARDCLTLL